MIIGVPKEIKNNECRVSILPVGVESLVRAGHQVLIERDAGIDGIYKDGDIEQVRQIDDRFEPAGRKIAGIRKDEEGLCDLIADLQRIRRDLRSCGGDDLFDILWLVILFVGHGDYWAALGMVFFSIVCGL